MLRYFCTLFISSLTAAAVWAQPAKQATMSFKTAMIQRDHGMWNEAVISFKKAIKLNKKYDSAYLELAQLYLKISQTDSAVLTLNTGIKVDPAFTAGYSSLGDIYKDYKKDQDSAILNYFKTYKLDSTNKLTLYNLAWCNNTKKNYREAVTWGVKALEIDNNYKPAYNELGHAYRQLKAYEECIEQFKKNLAISVNELPLLYSGYCYIELNQKENALKMYEQLNPLNPKMAGALKKKLDEMK